MIIVKREQHLTIETETQSIVIDTADNNLCDLSAENLAELFNSLGVKCGVCSEDEY